MGNLLQEFRIALRSLAKKPGFAAAAALTLALGVGANTVIFSLVDTVLLRPLAYPEPEQLVELWNHWQEQPQASLAGPELQAYMEVEALHSLAGFVTGSVSLTGSGEPQRVLAAADTGQLFQVLGISAAWGRTLQPGDVIPGAPDVAVLGHQLWRDAFGGDPAVVGREILIDGTPKEVVGVMPEGFQLPQDAQSGRSTQIFLPFTFDPANPGPWGAHYLQALGRIAPETSLPQAQAKLDAVVARIRQDNLGGKDAVSDPSFGARLYPLRQQVAGEFRSAAAILFGAVGLVLLIACVNVASLQLARAETRRRELALRTALGAGRWQLLRGLLAESLLLAAFGGLLGLLMAAWGLQVIQTLGVGIVPRLAEVELNGHVLAFTALISMAAGLFFGLLPAGQLQRHEPRFFLSGERGGGGSSQKLRRTLVVAEVALAALLVASSALLLKSLWSLQQVDAGFAAGGVVTLELEVPPTTYPDAAEVAGFFYQLESRLASIPGVEAAGGVSGLPLASSFGDWNFYPEGRVVDPGINSPRGDWQVVTPGYFETLAIPVLAGRAFTASDDAEAPLGVMINQKLAQKYWPGEDPVGTRIRLGGRDSNPNITILGIVGNVRLGGLDQEPEPQLYIAQAQMEEAMGRPVFRSLSVALRSSLPAEQVINQARGEILALDASLPISEIRTLEEIRRSSLGRLRLSALLISLFGSTALILGALGIFGVVSYLVARRTREIGIRLALGSGRRRVLSLVLREGFVLTALGLALGLGLSMLTRRALSHLLFEAAPTDPLILVAVILSLGLAAGLASYLPARRATRVNPVVALRQE